MSNEYDEERKKRYLENIEWTIKNECLIKELFQVSIDRVPQQSGIIIVKTS